MKRRECADHRPPSHRPGFTLVELAMVVAIIGILAALAVPRFAMASNRYRAKLGADRVMRDIAHARARAISLGAQQTINFSSVSTSYTIVGMQNPDAPAKPYTVALTAEPYRCTKLTIDFGGTETLTFNGFGVPTAGGTVVVQAGGYQCVVTVAAGTGAGTVGPLAAHDDVDQQLMIAWAE